MYHASRIPPIFRLLRERIRINLRKSAVDNEKDVGLAMGALAGLEAIASALGHEWQI